MVIQKGRCFFLSERDCGYVLTLALHLAALRASYSQKAALPVSSRASSHIPLHYCVNEDEDHLITVPLGCYVDNS